MQYSNLTLEVSHNVATVTIHRPEANNAIDLECARDLMHASIRCFDDPEIKAIIITGSKKVFCPGGDLKAFSPQGDNLPSHLKELTTYLHAAVSRFARGDAPIITAVNGVAAGAGMSLACIGDVVMACESAKFTTAYNRIGLTPDAGLTYFLPRLVGLQKAIDLTITSRVISASEAFDLGIVSRLVPDEHLIPKAQELARQLAQGSTGAMGISRRLMHRGLTETLETQLESESRALAKMSIDPESKKRISDFLKK